MKHSDGRTVPYTPGSAVSAGDVVVLSQLVGVALDDIAAGELGDLSVEGVFEFPRANIAVDWPIGTRIYWHPGFVYATTSASGAKLLGKLAQRSLRTADTCFVKLTQ